MKIDFEKFKQTLPYSSELYGVYQPLLGWKSKRIVRRRRLGFFDINNSLVSGIASRMKPVFDVSHFPDQREFDVKSISIATFRKSPDVVLNPGIDSYITKLIFDKIIKNEMDINEDGIWDKLVSTEALLEVLKEAAKDGMYWSQQVTQILDEKSTSNANDQTMQDSPKIIDSLLGRESVIAGTLSHMFQNKMFSQLRKLFQSSEPLANIDAMLQMNSLIDPLESFDPKSDLDNVCLSPLGMIHLLPLPQNL